MARVALKGFAAFTGQDAMSVVIALRAAKALWPTRLKQRRFALALSAKLFHKFGHRQPRLELHTIHRHDTPPGNFSPESRYFCRKIFSGILLEKIGKNHATAYAFGAPIRPRHLVPTQQGVGTLVLA